MRASTASLVLTAACCLIAGGETSAGEAVEHLGAGSIATTPPPGAKGPPDVIYRTAHARGKMPTNDWWSSLAWLPYSERQYAHPLAVQAGPGGLRVFYPGNHIAANKVGVFGIMPGGGGDLVLGHSEQAEFPDARVDGFSDWFVTAKFATPGRSMTVSYGHGSPYVYAEYEGGTPRLTFSNPPHVWSGDEHSPVLGITVNGTPYGLFGATGSTWTGAGSSTLANRSGKPYLSIALLPDASEQTLRLFRRYAHAHVTDTRVDWSYEPKAGLVTTTFRFTTRALEGSERGTLFALYPHQWRNTSKELIAAEYPSVRGVMKLAAGDSFQTVTRFPGVLPCLPNVGGTDRERIARDLHAEAVAPVPPLKDTYWEGKWLGRTATLVPIAEEYQRGDDARVLRERLRERLEAWFTATGPDGRVKSKGLFWYDDRWGTLIGCPASYGSDAELNDHHFHYGYFLRAAAEVARADPAWGGKDRFGALVDLLVRDIASPDRDDPRFPFLRNFDPYAGHSWASGHARFADGNNNESSSEAMNAWYGLILWGEAVGDRALRDLGVYLYTTEMTAINAYWFDIREENRPKSFTPSVATMIWGGKGVNETWFSANPEAVHGINWLPIHGGSLYLGCSPAYVEKNYAALVAENKGTTWDEWADLIAMYRALADPEDALRQFEAAGPKAPAEAGNSRANTEHWIESLRALGHVDPTVTGDEPLTAVFLRGKTRTYCVYSMTDRPRTVTFSDGHRVKVQNRGFTTSRGE